MSYRSHSIVIRPISTRRGGQEHLNGMTRFARELKARLRSPKKRKAWIFVPYDQLSSEIGPLSRLDPLEAGIIIIENLWKPWRRPYHKQKLALVLANMRHFALEQAARGVAVHHVQIDAPYRDAFPDLVRRFGPIQVMRPAERELRTDLAPLVASGALVEVAHEGWITSREVFERSHPKGPPYLLERFYRAARQTYKVLMDGKQPLGGQFNFDAENRHPWKPGDPEPPPLPSFPNDPIKQEAADSITEHMRPFPGVLNLDSLPVTTADAERLWSWAKQYALPNFGRFEDAMSTQSSSLFHTRISALLNLYRLVPSRIVRDAEALDIPIASKEGFIRQVLGWREFMHHVHEVTDGFRSSPALSAEVQRHPGDGGYQRWSGRAWPARSDDAAPDRPEPDGGACPSFLGADTPLPPAFWGQTSGLNCLDQVIAGVWKEGWSHHITRLMILSNLATLLDVSPRELTDWFWVAYVDAYDWVVEPNVLGLGSFAVGPLFTTKPYVSGANYIHRMSDFCEGCRFDPKKNCPFGSLYWAFLDRHRDLLEKNPRLGNIYRTLRLRERSGVKTSQEAYVQIRDTLVRGEELWPRGSLPL
jgi:deoxyribodipyrimidine photolyase-related protein